MANYTLISSTYKPNTATSSTNTTDNSANFDTIQENEKRKLQNQYNELIRQQTNALNKRGMFGSSVASEDVGKVNYALGQSLAELAGNTAQQKLAQNQQDIANKLAQNQLAQQATQFNQTLAYNTAQANQDKLAKQYQQDMQLATLQGMADPLNAKNYLNRVLNKYRWL